MPDIYEVPPALETLRRIEERTGTAPQVMHGLIAREHRSAGRQQPSQVGRQMGSIS
jgi:hypothetical protein